MIKFLMQSSVQIAAFFFKSKTNYMDDLIYGIFVAMQRALATIALFIGVITLIYWVLHLEMYHLIILGIMFLFLAIHLFRSAK